MQSMIKYSILPLMGSVLLFAACSTPAGKAEDGKKWYTMNNCSTCHGQAANNGKAAAISAIDMNFSRFERILRDPYSPSMPRFSETQVSKQDAADIYAWLKTMPK